MSDPINHFCGFKTAYHLDENVMPSITDGIVEWDGISGVPQFMTHFSKHVSLPKHWEILETGISGASGFVIVFEVDCYPEKSDLQAVHEALLKYEPFIKSELEVYRASDRFIQDE